MAIMKDAVALNNTKYIFTPYFDSMRKHYCRLKYLSLEQAICFYFVQEKV